MEINEEELKYMRDPGRTRSNKQITTAEIVVHQTNENHINSELDLDGIMEKWTVISQKHLKLLRRGCMSSIPTFLTPKRSKKLFYK